MEIFHKIAVMGAGAMGTLLGAVLSDSGREVHLIDTRAGQVEALKKRGAVIEGTVSLQVPVRAFAVEEMQGPYDLIFLLVKQTYSQEALQALGPHLHEESVVCTLQNGVPEPVVEACCGSERTLGCAVTWAATATAPGITRCTTTPERWQQCLGRMDGKITPQVLAVAGVLERVCPTEVTDNLPGVRWSKLLINSALSGVSAVLGCSFGGLLANDEALRCVQAVARECVHTARSQGIKMAPLTPGEDLGRLMDYFTEEDRIKKSRIFFQLLGGPENPGKSSMLQDLERGELSEVDYINGYVLNVARVQGVPTPCCASVVALIHEIQKGKRKPGLHNLRELHM